MTWSKASDHAMHQLAERPRYTREQMETYVQKINRNNPNYNLASLENEIRMDPLAALTGLQRKQMAFNPWGNIALHYSWHGSLSLDTEALYKKMVERHLGGYCMENNTFFAAVLESLGYQYYITGARISNAVEMNGKHPDSFAGWQHEVIIVSIKDSRYLVDVGFGPQGAIEPVLLTHNAVALGLPGNDIRLIKRGIAQATDSSQQMWVKEFRNATSNTWTAAYCFAEVEWLPEDFSIINFRTSNDPRSWFTYRLVLTKIILDDELQNAVGSITLMNDNLSQRIGPNPSETLLICRSEAQRVEALEKYFDIKLLPEEAHGISGRAVELVGH